MYLKHLELQGFKSFAKRTIFDFNAGITAIVGPNGVGKSNIADAIRWVMGEQSYKSLRARQGEDLIFAGSQGRTRLGMAEAVLTLDNTSGWLPIEYSEVSIARRAYRSGENEYLLNGNRVRRREIVELLAKGGLSSKAYTVISQGLTDAALAMRPQERRTLFEEAAGITIYQSKRDSALRKLEATEENLRRVNDIIAEITPHLESLRRQAERAAEYNVASHELEENLKVWYGYQWQRQSAAFQEAKRLEKEKREALAGLRDRLQGLTQELKAIDSRQEELAQSLALWRKEKEALRQEQEALLRGLAVSQERLRLLKRQEGEIDEEVASLTRRSENLRLSVQELDRDSSALSLQERLSQAQELAFQLATRSAELRSQLSQIRERERDLLKERDEEKETLAALRLQISHLEGIVAQLEREKRTLEVERGALAEKRERQGAGLEASLLRQKGLQAQEEEVEARYQVLSKMRRGFSGRPEAKAVSHEGVLGTLASLIEVPPPLEAALRAALGPLMEGLVVRSWKDAERLMQDRPILFPLDSIKASQTPPPPRGPGILGLAFDQVESAHRFRHLLQALLGHTLIVEDLTTAKRLHQEDATGFQFVTLEGELLTPQGALIAGAPQFEGLERALEREMTSLEEEKPHIQEQLRREKERHHRLLSEMQTLEKREQELGERLGAKEGDLSEQQKRLERLLQEVEWRRAIETKAREELEQIRASIAGLSLQVERSEAQEKDTLAALARLQEQMTTWGAEGEESMAHLALLKERKENLEQLEAQIETKEARKRELAQEIETLTEEVETLEARAWELSTRLTALQRLIEPAKEELTSLERKQRRQEREEAHLHDDLHRCEVEHSQAVSEVERSKDRLAALQGQIETDLEDLLVAPLPKQLTLDMDARLVSLPSISQIPQGLEKKIKRLNRRLRKMGPVNIEAPAEYEKIDSRHDFLTSQAEDLEKASRSLRQMIAELNRLMEERFKETFSATAKEFSNYFTALFNGGRGKLLLTDPQNPSQTGVEIVSQPPGKRRQSIDLLSGGERALTGVALVFAILKATATPFCFLDEVDATLDEINIGRFRDSLKALAQATQIVIITHNRYTIEAADTIYGLSLGEDSASQVISLRLEDVET